MPKGAITVLESGKRIPADTVMYSAGRHGMTDDLGLEAAGLTADHRGRTADTWREDRCVPPCTSRAEDTETCEFYCQVRWAFNDSVPSRIA